VTIPERSVRDLPKGLFDGVPRDVVVADTGNYYPTHRDGLIQEIESGKTESRWVSDRLGRPVVKAFNNIRAQSLGAGDKPKGARGRIALPVAGDDPRAKTVVMRLVEDLGFDPIDAGGLDESWRQQPGTPVYAADFDADRVKRALAEASPERPARFHADAGAPPSRKVAESAAPADLSQPFLHAAPPGVPVARRPLALGGGGLAVRADGLIEGSETDRSPPLIDAVRILDGQRAELA
jgi:predicted dinucleotide-binding enzyme